MPNPTQTPKDDSDDCTLYLRPVPTDIKNFFKAECARRNITMLEAQIEFMRNCQKIIPQLKKLKAVRETSGSAAQS